MWLAHHEERLGEELGHRIEDKVVARASCCNALQVWVQSRVRKEVAAPPTTEEQVPPDDNVWWPEGMPDASDVALGKGVPSLVEFPRPAHTRVS